MTARLATTAACLVSALALAATPALADHEGPFGTNFGVADAEDFSGNPVPPFSGWSIDDPADDTPKAFWTGPCDTELGDTDGSGMGTPPSPTIHCVDPDSAYFELGDADNPDFPVGTTWQPGDEPSWRLDVAGQAGAHPDMTVSFWLRRWAHSPKVESQGATGVDVISDGEPKDSIVKLPAGMLGNPNAVPLCPAELVRLTPPACPPETQVGIAEVALARGTDSLTGEAGDNQRVPVWNVEPRKGKLAEFMLSANINEQGRVNVPIVARARTDGDFGVDALALDLSPGLPVLSTTVTLWGQPFAASHDKFRPPVQYVAAGNEGIPADGFPDAVGNQPQPYEPSWGPVRPFLTNPTECDPANPPITQISMASWRFPDDFRTYATDWDQPVSGCAAVPFGERGVGLDLQPTSNVADGPSGLTADLDVPQIDLPPFEAPEEGDPQEDIDDYLADTNAHWKSEDGLGTAQLEKAVVTLPAGVSINPSAAAGLAGCSDAQFGIVDAGVPARFNNDDPFDGKGAECPAGSRIGTVEAYTPVLPRTGDQQPGETNLVGDVVLGAPRAGDVGRFNQGLKGRILLVLRSEERGLVAKIAGLATTDPQTGRLTTTFEQSPRVPVEHLRLNVKGGQRGMLALQQRCVSSPWSSTLTPWTAAHGGGGESVSDSGNFTPTSNCGFGFAPQVAAGMSNTAGGANGVFSLTVSRRDGEQWITGLTSKLPKGLLADVGSVDLCTNAQIQAYVQAEAADSKTDRLPCPAASRVGTVDAAAGSGTPFVLERKGSAFLTEGYKGAPYGLATVVPVETGPFRGPFALDTVMVRQALHVDTTDASVTAVSDPLPQMWHGIPLRMRQVTIKMDRPNFTRNPTSCAPKELETTLTSAQGTKSTVKTPFRASACGRLPFKPKLAVRLTGKRQTTSGKHPGIRAVVTQGSGQAGIARAKVRLPRTLALDSDNARALCEFVDGTKPDLENHCPKGSIVGRAKAVSPLLRRPLAGNVYFVKNIRIDPDTGAVRRTLPMVVVALRGEISVNLRGKSSTGAGNTLVNTFEGVPDAPLSRFELNIAGGRNGIILVTENARGKLDICRGKQVFAADMDAQNGRRHDRDVRAKTPCAKKKKARKRKRSRRR